MTDKKSVSIYPSSFADSYLLSKSVDYVIPADTEKRSRLSVSGFPTKLLNALYFNIPNRFDGKWRKSVANVERFLLSVGVPLLNDATVKCSKYTALMSDAVDGDDDNKQIQLRSMRFLYSIDDMRISGGREIGEGGVPVQCLDQDVQVINDVRIRLGRTGVTQSALVVLTIIWALSTDCDNQIIAPQLQKICQQVVVQFKEKVVRWEEELRGIK
jgi:hypothetical protein